MHYIFFCFNYICYKAFFVFVLFHAIFFFLALKSRFLKATRNMIVRAAKEIMDQSQERCDAGASNHSSRKPGGADARIGKNETSFLTLKILIYFE